MGAADRRAARRDPRALAQRIDRLAYRLELLAGDTPAALAVYRRVYQGAEVLYTLAAPEARFAEWAPAPPDARRCCAQAVALARLAERLVLDALADDPNGRRLAHYAGRRVRAGLRELLRLATAAEGG